MNRPLALSVAALGLSLSTLAAAQPTAPPPVAQPAVTPPTMPPVAPASSPATPVVSPAVAPVAPPPAPAATISGTPAPTAPATLPLAASTASSTAAPEGALEGRVDEKPPLGLAFSVTAGLRTMLLPGAGFDPYSGNDVLNQFSLAVGVTVLRAGALSVVVGPEWDTGSSSARARAADASLGLHRFAGFVEGRYHLANPFYLSAKVAPAAYYISGSLREPGTSTAQALASDVWVFGMDATVGAGLRVGKLDTQRGGVFGVWVNWEIGCSLAGSAAMRFTQPSVDGTPPNPGSTTLPSFQPGGFVNKLAIGLSF